MIPLGLTFLGVAMLCCLIAVGNARAIMQRDELVEDDEGTDWLWPARRD